MPRDIATKTVPARTITTRVRLAAYTAEREGDGWVYRARYEEIEQASDGEVIVRKDAGSDNVRLDVLDDMPGVGGAHAIIVGALEKREEAEFIRIKAEKEEREKPVPPIVKPDKDD
jgi:hypothetical protein